MPARQFSVWDLTAASRTSQLKLVDHSARYVPAVWLVVVVLPVTSHGADRTLAQLRRLVDLRRAPAETRSFRVRDSSPESEDPVHVDSLGIDAHAVSVSQAEAVEDEQAAAGSRHTSVGLGSVTIEVVTVTRAATL